MGLMEQPSFHTCSGCSSSTWSFGQAHCRSSGPAARTTSWRGTFRAAQEGGGWRALTRSYACSAHWYWPGQDRARLQQHTAGRRPTAGSPFMYSRNVNKSAGAATSGALLRTGSRGTSSSSCKGSGLVKSPADVVGAPGAAIGAGGQVRLRGAGTHGGGLPPAARLPHAQPAAWTRTGTEHPALDGVTSPFPRGLTGTPVGSGGIARYGRGWVGVDGTWRALDPPAPLVAVPPPTAELATQCAIFFHDISRTHYVTGATTARLLPAPLEPRRSGGGRWDGPCAGGRPGLCAVFTYFPSFAVRRPPR